MARMQKHCALIVSWLVFVGNQAIAQTCSGTESVCGQWGPLTPLKLNNPTTPNQPMQAIHSFLLPNGKVLCIDGYNTPTDTHALLLNPSDGVTQLVSNDYQFIDHLTVEFPHQLFCSGHARLADGRIVFRGGGIDPGPGTPATTVYDPNGVHATYGAVGTFTVGPLESWDVDGDQDPEETQRWYPTCTTLGDGRILITDGAAGGQGNPNVPVILQLGSEEPWTPLELAEIDLQLYPLMYQLKGGSVFMAGSHYNDADDPNTLITRTLSIGLEQWAPIGSTGTKAGSGCMFSYIDGAIQREIIFKAGGGTTGTQLSACTSTAATNRAFKIDFSAQAPAWSEVAPMPQARLHFYLIPLPSGEVLATGGTFGGANATEHQMCNGPNAVLSPDLYNPTSDTWTTLAAMATPRQYHSSALLLPDGSVFVAGGQANGPDADPNWAVANQRTYQIFKPPYFFNGTRPTITTCPANWTYNRGYNIDTPNAAEITKVRMIRLGSATHSFDHDTRSLEVAFTQLDGDTIRVSAPQHGMAAPPGHYMVFICKEPAGSGSGGGRLPSLGKIVKLDGGIGLGSP